MADQISPGAGATPDRSAPELVRISAKWGRLLLAGRITQKEFADALHGHLGDAGSLDHRVVTDIIAVLPREAGPAMTAALSAVLAPGFCYPYTHGLRMSDAERQAYQARSVATARVWAEALLAALQVAADG